MERPNVSIIIPTYNSEATLENCLESIRDQSYVPIETIVVDNMSNDATVKIAKKSQAKIIQQKSNPASARNIGIANSTGKYVFFIDSDQVLSRSLVEECVKKCEEEKARMVRVPEVFVGKDFWSSCSAAWKNRYAKTEEKYGTNQNIMPGKPRFFLKEQLLGVGMLDPALLWGEDLDLHRRLIKIKTKEVSCRSKLYHYEPVSVKKILVKNMRYGRSMPTFERHSKDQVGALLVRHSLLTLREMVLNSMEKPSIVLGCIFLLGLKACAMMIGFVMSLG